jgi:tetratricopeptide (TPR) repeat protein
LALALAAYGPAYRAGFVWDDDSYVTANPTLEDRAGLVRIWLDAGANPQYYPLVFTSFWIERRLWGLDPTGYHAVNVLLHGMSAVLLWRALGRLAVPGAWLAGALFALHPVHVESVAWIAERKNVLSGVFFLSALVSYLRGALGPLRAQPTGRAAAGGGQGVFFLLSFVLYVLALLSKTVTAVLPASLAFLLVWKRGRLERRDFFWLGSMGVVGFWAASRTAWLEIHQVGAQGEAFELSLVERSLIAGRAFWFYLGKLAWPVPLCFVYPKWEIEPAAPAAWAFLASAVLLFAGLVALRRRLGGGPLAAFLHFAVALGPASGFFNVFPMRYSFVADHFQYLASLGPLSLAAAAGSRAFGGPARLAGRAGAVLLLAVLGVLTWKQAATYRDLETLWRATIERNPAATLAHWNLGRLLEERGDLDAAIAHYRAGLEIEPDHGELLVNLGNALARKGAVEEAIRCFERAIELDPRHPRAHYNLGVLLEQKGDSDRAFQEYLAAVRPLPDPGAIRTDFDKQVFALGRFGELGAAAHGRLAGLLLRSGKNRQAIAHYRAALSFQPDRPDLLANLANALAAEGRLEEAIPFYRRAIQLAPDDAVSHYNLALAYEERSELDRAILEYREALRLDPGFGAAHNNLAILYYKRGDYEAAWKEVEQARRHGVEPRRDFLEALSAKRRPASTF